MYRQRVRHRYRAAIGWCALFLLLGTGKVATAWHLHDQPFGFRLLATQDRNLGFSPVAHPIFSSNPAADDFMREAPFTYKAAPGLAYEYTGLGAGGFVSTVSLAGYFRPSDEGTFMGVLGRTDVFNSTTRQGEKFTLNSTGVTLRYSRHVQPNITLGASAKFTGLGSGLEDSETKINSSGFISEFTLGILGSLNENWTAGMLMTQAPLWSWTNVFSDGSKTYGSSKTLLSRYRPGIGWRPSPTFGLYVEGEYIRVATKDAKMNFARGNLLAEYFPTPVIALRAGAILDSAAKFTYNAGFGYYGFSAVKFDVGYSHNAFAEVRHEFGKMHYLFIILSTAF
jgi:hypothetical protein